MNYDDDYGIEDEVSDALSQMALNNVFRTLPKMFTISDFRNGFRREMKEMDLGTTMATLMMAIDHEVISEIEANCYEYNGFLSEGFDLA